jgi:hypothetical protein
MMRTALPEQTANARPYTLSTWLGRCHAPNPRTFALALSVAIGILVAAIAAAVLFAVTPAGASVTRASGTPTTMLEQPGPGRSRLSTTYAGPASCAEPGFLTGDTLGDANPAAVYRTLCTPASAQP